MSSHREAPEISKDPVADNTDVYAFVSPDRPNKVTLIANFIPGQAPWGGPNFYEFGDDVLYRIHISNRGKGRSDIAYEFRFHTFIWNDKTFLYNTGPITSIHDATWNRPQYYTVTRVEHGPRTVLGKNLAVPPVNVGIRSTPDYTALSNQGVHHLDKHRRVFAGQCADPFWVDLGSIFDLGALRPFQDLHLIPSAAAAGVNGLQTFNVHTIALQVPKSDLTADGRTHHDATDPHATIGVWASTSRQSVRMYGGGFGGGYGSHGSRRQVSRLGNPLFNEVIVPMAREDGWNADSPVDDSQYASLVAKPELAKLLPVLYPGVFKNLAAYKKPRADLLAILLTGIPAGVVPGFQNYTGPTQADMLRLNTAIPPAKKPNPLGLVAGDPAGFPNGRRLTDDVVTVELRAIAGLTIPLVDPSYKPDAAAKAIRDGSSNTDSPIRDEFPYVGVAASGYKSKPGIPKV